VSIAPSCVAACAARASWGALTIVLQQPGENLVGDSDDLQRLAQIVTGHRQ
jgi:hypothetical protein